MIFDARAATAAAIVIAFTVGACGATRPSITLTPIGVAHVRAASVPPEVRGFAQPADLLRVDFYSSPELLAEDTEYMMDEVRFCDGSRSDLNRVSSPFVDGQSIRRLVPRQRVRAARASGPDAQTKPVYSTYLYVARPAYAATQYVPAQPAYDLAREPQSLCVLLRVYEGYEPIYRATNTIEFSAEQIGAALRAR
jgi:hypothetical protein